MIDLKFSQTFFLISIELGSLLCTLHTFLSTSQYTMHFLSHLIQNFNFRVKSCYGDWSSTFFIIQSIKWTHLYVSMISLVIRKLYQIQRLISKLLSIPNVHYEHFIKNPIGSLTLSICFWMMYKTHTKFGATQFGQRFLKFTHEFSMFVINYLLRQSIIHKYLFNKQLSHS